MFSPDAPATMFALAAAITGLVLWTMCLAFLLFVEIDGLHQRIKSLEQDAKP